MNRFKLEEMVEEFPFLPQVSRMVEDGDYASLDIKVKRWTPELLAMTPTKDVYRSSAGNSDDTDLFYVVYHWDNSVRELRHAGSWSSGAQHEPTQHFNAGTILEQIGDDKNIAHLVRKEYSTCGWRESDETVYITIYKPAKDIAISDLVYKAKDKARRQVEAEIAF